MFSFRFFRKRTKYTRPSIEHVSLVERRAEEFRRFYEERFGYGLNYEKSSLHLLDVILSEARDSTLSHDRKQWLAMHAGAYLFRMVSQRFPDWPMQYLWYHPLEQLLMVIGPPTYRISLLAHQAVLLRLDALPDLPVSMLFQRFEKAVLSAKAGDDQLFM